ncbi:hypothetical protein C8R46DRAFT_1287144 [Mycena filopes]|nr:hypothetical protein C8R46DRAFT_1287144 [Mycena filopes]
METQHLPLFDPVRGRLPLLERLTLSGSTRFDMSVGTSEMTKTNAFALAPRLTRLDFHIILDLLPSLPLHQLKVLFTSHSSIALANRCSNLTVLICTDIVRETGSPVVTNATTLHLHTGIIRFHDATAPRATYLRLVGVGIPWSQPRFALFAQRSECATTLHTLVLDDILIHGNDLIALFPLIPAVRSLRMHALRPHALTDKVVHALTPDGLLPELTALTVEGSYLFGSASLLTMLEARAPALRAVTLHLKHRQFGVEEQRRLRTMTQTSAISDFRLPLPCRLDISMFDSSSAIIRVTGRTTITWENYALVAAAVAYLYDFIVTLPNEVKLHDRIRSKGNFRGFLQFLPLRYFSLVYQIVVLSGLARSDLTAKVSQALYPTPCLTLANRQRCGVLDNLTLSIDSAFQFAYVAVLCWRTHTFAFDNWILTSALAALGFAAPLINVIVPNPSIFPECRILYSPPPSKISEAILRRLKEYLIRDTVLLLPSLRSAFDALMAGSFVVCCHKRWKGADLMQELIREEIHDLIIIFAIITMEAVFVQMPSVSQDFLPFQVRFSDQQARIHARNYIAPFVDSEVLITASLATRFLMGMGKKAEANEERIVALSRRASVDSSPTPPHSITFSTNPQQTNLSDTPSVPPSIMTSPTSWQEAVAIHVMNNNLAPRALEL